MIKFNKSIMLSSLTLLLVVIAFVFEKDILMITVGSLLAIYGLTGSTAYVVSELSSNHR